MRAKIGMKVFWKQNRYEVFKNSFLFLCSLLIKKEKKKELKLQIDIKCINKNKWENTEKELDSKWAEGVRSQSSICKPKKYTIASTSYHSELQEKQFTVLWRPSDKNKSVA